MTNENTENPIGGLFRASGVRKSVGVYLPAVTFFRGLSFVRSLVLAWWLSKLPGEFGLLNLALLSVNVLAPLASFGLTEAITRYVSAYESRKQLARFLAWGSGLAMAVSLLFTLVMLALVEPLGNLLFATPGVSHDQIIRLSRVTFLTNFILLFYFLIIAVLKGLRMYQALSLMELFHTVLYFLMTILALWLFPGQVTMVMWAYLVAMLIPAALWSLMLNGKISPDDPAAGPIRVPRVFWQLVTFGIWSAVAGVFWQAWQTYSLWHLTHLPNWMDTGLDATDAGRMLRDTFSASRTLGQLIFILGSATAGVIMTNVCAVWEKGRRENAVFLFDLYAKGAILLLLVVSVLMICLRGPLTLIFPRQWARLAEILPATLLYFHFLSVLAFLSVRFVLLEKMHLMPWAWLVGLIANVGLCFLWIGSGTALWGAAAAAAWSCVPAIILAIMLIRRQSQPVSVGLYLVILASFLLLLPGWLAGLGAIFLVLWAILGNDIFSDRQRALVIERLLSRKIK